jgi:alcohol dehydrogenase YqhD (iron-dependent ADH family)
MLNFRYNIPTEILFGQNQISRLGNEIIKYSSNCLLVYGEGSIKKSGLYSQVIDLLKESNISFWELGGVKPNPRITSVREGVKICKENNISFVLAVGAGSVIDAAKAIAAGVFYDGDAWDFFSHKAAVSKALPVGTVLTLAATGSEMNGNSVITNEETKQKLSTGNFVLRPKFSVLDPTYTFSVSKYQTAAGVVDIMSHVFEQYFSPVKNTFIQDRLAEAILKTCIHYGPIAIDEPNNYEARANLMWAGSLALNGLLAFGKRGDWVTHGIEHEISAIYDLTHGVGLSIITPSWMEYVLDKNNAGKFAALAKNIWDFTDDIAEIELAKKCIEATKAFFIRMGMPVSFKEVNISDQHFEEIAEKSISAHSENQIGSFKKLNKRDIKNILLLSI